MALLDYARGVGAQRQMPRTESPAVSPREEFVQLARRQTVAFGHLCRRFGISLKTSAMSDRNATTAKAARS